MADSMRNNAAPPTFPSSFLAAFKASAGNSTTPYRLDEGYSEDTDSRADSRMGDHEPQGQSLVPEWIANMSTAERTEFAYAILRSLPTSNIANLVDRLNPLLHIDPVLYLPPEITHDIFSFLDPETLLKSSALSSSWRVRTLDSRLWRNLFGSEGWNPNIGNVKQFQEEQRARLRRHVERKSRARPSEAVSDAESKSPKKRARERTLFGDASEDNRSMPGPSRQTYSPQWAAQHDVIEADGDEKMVDAPLDLDKVARRHGSTSSSSASTPNAEETFDPSAQTPLLIQGAKDPSVNWQYLYKQKRRLEANWDKGRFKNFQLPHPKHPEEAHAECVYTIQYSGHHLVSGSRDKTLRIWNLDTQRLAVKPLRGHDASVLCLQFDHRPEQDVVISGGSDCHVIIWKFSTGEMLQKLERAHSESVLNLRFDARYLITCSKDKTIKVWNRNALRPSDDAYPSRSASASTIFPSYIVNIDNLMDTDLHNIKPIKEYSLLMTLHGHQAAVNAIQVLDSQIVSASGDRQIKIWNVRTGQCLKTIAGHNKGIACVQFDGRRIVSGSSDETVRVFDAITGAEVAQLTGHQNLVRTVQARFGDFPGSHIEEEAEARAIDRKFLTAKLSGTLGKQQLTKEQRQARNAGSKDPKDIFAVGAKLPPGGGGSKWARIVSGSYDETVIIWRRAADGKWTQAHRFYQWEAVMKAGGQPRNMPGQQPPRSGHPVHPIPQPAAVLHQPDTTRAPGHLANIDAAQSQLQSANMASQPQPHLITQIYDGRLNGMTQAQVIQHLSVQMNPVDAAIADASGAPVQQSTFTSPSSMSNPTVSSSMVATTSVSASAVAQAGLPHQQVATQASVSLQNVLLPNGQTFQQAMQAFPLHVQPLIATALLPGQQASQALPHHPHAQHHPNLQQMAQGHHPHAPGANPATPNNGTNSRVFKLQFDSRRIICCSQDPTIVGWDFADGDAEIEEASRFFGEDY